MEDSKTFLKKSTKSKCFFDTCVCLRFCSIEVKNSRKNYLAAHVKYITSIKNQNVDIKTPQAKMAEIPSNTNASLFPKSFHDRKCV